MVHMMKGTTKTTDHTDGTNDNNQNKKEREMANVAKVDMVATIIAVIEIKNAKESVDARQKRLMRRTKNDLQKLYGQAMFILNTDMTVENNTELRMDQKEFDAVVRRLDANANEARVSMKMYNDAGNVTAACEQCGQVTAYENAARWMRTLVA